MFFALSLTKNQHQISIPVHFPFLTCFLIELPFPPPALLSPTGEATALADGSVTVEFLPKCIGQVAT